VLPHLMLPQLREGLCQTTARRVLTMNLATDTKETSGMSAADHLDVIRRYAPEMRFDYVLADPGAVEDRGRFEQAAGLIGAQVVFGKVGSLGGDAVHDPLRLAAAYHDIFGGSEAQQMQKPTK
jgi:hypothetical protein